MNVGTLASACAQALASVACESCIPSSPKSPRASPRAARTAAPPTSSASAPPRPKARPAASSAARTSPTASPRAAPTRSCTCAPPSGATSRSSPPTTTCSRPTSRSSATPRSSRRPCCEAGGVAQFAGGVPAMCDGITQGRAGMELSLFSRDVVAMATAVALSHDMFDGALMLGVCDKIVPGPADRRAVASATCRPSSSPPGRCRPACPTARRAAIRQLPRGGQGRPRGAARGRVAVLPLARHLHVLRHRELQPARGRGDGPAPAGRELRQPGHAAAPRADRGGRAGVATHGCAPIGEIVDERALVNGVVALLATGGSTNHTMHLVAVAAAAGLALTWDDFADLSAVVPLLARVYPNGAGRHQPLPRRRRHAVPDRRAARRRAHAPGRRHGRRATASAATATSRTSTTTASCAGGPRRARVARRRRAAPGARRRSRPTAASACSTARSAAR